MKAALTTPHLLFAAIALALTASTIWAQIAGTVRPAYAHASRDTTQAYPGFSGAFGDGAVVRNLLY